VSLEIGPFPVCTVTIEGTPCTDRWRYAGIVRNMRMVLGMETEDQIQTREDWFQISIAYT